MIYEAALAISQVMTAEDLGPQPQPQHQPSPQPQPLQAPPNPSPQPGDE